MHRFLVACAAVIGVIALVPSQAAAGAKGHGWVNGGEVGAVAEAEQAVPRTTGGPAPINPNAPVCRFETVSDAVATSAEFFSRSPVGTPKPPGAGKWYKKACDYPDGTRTGLVMWVVEAGDPVALANQALSFTVLNPPTVSASPGFDQLQLVNLPVWLWINGDNWRPVTASASAGGVTVTTTATPTRMLWNMGDGTTKACAGPGTPYDPKKPDRSQQSDCTYTYKKPSVGQPGGAFGITATQEWRVRWTAVGVPPGAPAAGDLGVLTRTSNASVRVGEFQTLNRRK